MKANEAPEKLYIDLFKGEFNVSYSPTNNSVEYTRTDDFIEKALKWYCLDCECNDNCKDSKCFFHNEFKRYLEGNEHAIPPKFETAILNPDGSTTENWRHRHFIMKMQDAFIEKACEFLKSYRQEMYNGEGYVAGIVNDETINDFKNYMRGE